jgi:predicted dehydrogenase
MRSAPADLRFCLSSLDHDHAWWMADHILETPGVCLVGVADQQSRLLDKMRARLGDSGACYADVGEMLDRLAPDALIVTAPNSAHRALVEHCARRGIHCLVQKPLATTYADAAAIQQMVERAGIKLMVNYYPLWNPEKAELFRRVLGGEIGEVQQMTIVNGHQGPQDMGVLTDDYIAWLYDPLRHGGGVLADQGTYGLGYVVWVLGAPQSVLAAELPLKQHPQGWVDDSSTVVLTYPRATAVVMASWAWPHSRDEILCYGSQGSMCLRDHVLVRKRASVRFDVPVEAEPIAPPATPPERQHGIAWFAHCLRHDLPVETPFTAALNGVVCQIVEAAQQSAREGRAIAL